MDIFVSGLLLEHCRNTSKKAWPNPEQFQMQTYHDNVQWYQVQSRVQKDKTLKKPDHQVCLFELPQRLHLLELEGRDQFQQFFPRYHQHQVRRLKEGSRQTDQPARHLQQ
jgi:hypothetical protein